MAIQLGSAYGKIIIDSSGVTRGVNSSVQSLKGMNSSLKELGATLKTTGAAMTAAFTLPVLAAGRSAMNTFMDYEKAMNVLGAVTNATGEQMQELSALAKELGADITLPGTSAADAAEAMAELAKAGLDVNEVMAAAKGVLQMSAAGQLGNAEAAEITANALNVFNLEGSEAVRVADLLAAAANSSSGEVRDMADALQMSASVFATAGMEIEELVAAISLMSNAGIQGSDAGTSLKQMLLSLQAPSKNAKALMNELGINIYDASGKMLDMRSIIDIFSTQMSGLTQEQRNFALATIFGSDAVRAANIVLMGGVEAYDTMLGKVTEVGAASKLASALMEGLTGSMENLKSAFETAAIAAIEPLKDDLKVLIDFAVKLLNAFADLPEPVREGIVKLILFAAVLGPILMLLGSLLPMLGNVTKSLNPFSGGIFGLVGTLLKLLSVAAIVVKVLGVFGISTGVAGAKILALQAAISGAGMSLLALLGQILLLAAGPVLLYWAFKTNFMGITDTAKQLWFILKYYFREGFVSLGGLIVQGFDKIKNIFMALWRVFDPFNEFVLLFEDGSGALHDLAMAFGFSAKKSQELLAIIWSIVSPLSNVTLLFEDGSGAIHDLAVALGFSAQKSQEFLAVVWSILSSLSNARLLFEDGSGALLDLAIAFGIPGEAAQNFLSRMYFVASGFSQLLKGNMLEAVKDFAMGLLGITNPQLEALANRFREFISRIIALFHSFNWSSIGRYIIQGLIIGLLGGIPALVAAAMKVAEAVQNAFDRKMDINSPSGWFEKRGEYSWMGYMKGWGKMDAGAISKALAKPVVQQASGMQNNNSLYFSSGLTLRDVDRLSNQKFERYTRELNAALGG